MDPTGIIALVAGLLLLFFGKRLFWLAAGLVAFLFGYQLFGNLFGVWWSLLIGVILGIIFAWLSIKFVKMAAYFIAFLAGAIALPFLMGIFGIEMSWFFLALIGGAIGLILVAVAFDWGLILITAWAGASAVTFGLKQWWTLDGTFGMVIFLVLMVVGVLWQASQRRKK
jgi:hypothetical protein